MTTAQWIIYYAAELIVAVPELSVAEATRLATRACVDGIELQPEAAARAAMATT